MPRHYRIARSLTPSAGPRKTLDRGLDSRALGITPARISASSIEVVQEFLTQPVAEPLGRFGPPLFPTQIGQAHSAHSTSFVPPLPARPPMFHSAEGSRHP